MPQADFSSANSLIRWAREDIQDLEAATKIFLANRPYTILREPDPESGHVFVKVRVADVPDEICKLASHALWDIKHALDHATCAAVRAIRGNDIGDIHFPIAAHPNDLFAKLTHIPKRQTLPKYPVELHALFQKLEPYPTSDAYPGGGDEFVALSKLANTTKHSVALGTGARSHFASAKGSGPILKMFLDSWDSSKQELTLCLVRAGATDFKMDIQIATYIGFRDVDALEGHPAGDTLSGFATCVQTIISDLKAEVG